MLLTDRRGGDRQRGARVPVTGGQACPALRDRIGGLAGGHALGFGPANSVTPGSSSRQRHDTGSVAAGAFGTGWPFYVINLSVTLVLAFAANTSFGGLPVLLQLLARDHRMPHMFALRAEKPVFRYGVTVLALLAAAVLLIVDADTQRLLPVFAIGVFIGFTISQTGLVLHWRRERGPRWLGYILLNGFGAVLTAIAGIVLFASKFTEGAWLLLILVPGLIILFNGI